jgi:enoyl-CoA hydratase/carnithine racemase
VGVGGTVAGDRRRREPELTTQYGPLRVDLDGRVAHVVIDHPPLQLVDGSLLVGLQQLLDAFDATPPGAVVVTSADPDFFLMHGDVEMLAGVPPRPFDRAPEPNAAAATFERLARAPYLTIGVLDGAARGGGAELLTALDLRIGTPRAVLGQPEVAMGILPGAGGTARLPHVLGRGRALEVILTGRDVEADEALAIGWLHAVVDATGAVAHATGIARRVAAMPPAGIAAVKRVVATSLDAGVAAGLLAETNALGELMASGAHVEPMRRYLAAGGQTRNAETVDTAPLIEVMLDRSL